MTDMRCRLCYRAIVVGLWAGMATSWPGSSLAQTPAPPSPGVARSPRIVHRELPFPDGVRRALAAGTRDASGRPGQRYWQLWTDYTIHARLDPATSTVTGRETITIQNPSPAAIRQILLRLDQNLFRADALKAWSAGMASGDTTVGLTVTKLAVDGTTGTITVL